MLLLFEMNYLTLKKHNMHFPFATSPIRDFPFQDTTIIEVELTPEGREVYSIVQRFQNRVKQQVELLKADFLTTPRSSISMSFGEFR
jgi:hypothetical protein